MNPLNVIFALTLMCACSSGTQHIVDNTQWSSISGASGDPFAAAAEGKVLCSSEAIEPELFNQIMGVTVSTEDCSYATLSQETQIDLSEGDRVTLNMWHYRLTSPEGGEAHMAVQLGEDLIWEDFISIPAETAGTVEEIKLTSDYPIGTPVFFHVTNHGQNAYSLVEFTVSK
jgi:hypothetical protein